MTIARIHFLNHVLRAQWSRTNLCVEFSFVRLVVCVYTKMPRSSVGKTIWRKPFDVSSNAAFAIINAKKALEMKSPCAVLCDALLGQFLQALHHNTSIHTPLAKAH